MTHLRQVTSMFIAEFGREPTAEEAAKVMGVSAADAEIARDGLRQITSLDQVIGEADNLNLSDLYEDESALQPPQEAHENSLRREIERLLDTLSDREGAVLRMRYGLGDGCRYSLEQVAKTHNVTRERIRQIEIRALSKLKHPRRLASLIGYQSDHDSKLRFTTNGEGASLSPAGPRLSQVSRDHEPTNSSDRKAVPQLRLPRIPIKARRAIARGIQRDDPVAKLAKLGLTQRVIRLLEDSEFEIIRLRDLIKRRPEELMQLGNLGEKSVVSIVQCLARYQELDQELAA